MKEIVDYVIVFNHKVVPLNKEVQDFIKKGYQPKGDLVIDNNQYMHQVMVKYKEEPQEQI